MTTAERGEFALFLVALLLGLASFSAPAPIVLSAPAFVLSAVMFVRVVRRLPGGAR